MKPVPSPYSREELLAYIAAHYAAPIAPDVAAYSKSISRKSAANAIRPQSAPTQDALCEASVPPVFGAAPMRADGLSDVLRQKESGFSEHLLSLLSECGEKDSAVYRRAQISRQLFHKILNDRDYQPSKSTAIQLALGLGLNVEEAQRLLRAAGKSPLYPRLKRDAVILYGIQKKLPILAVQESLTKYGLTLLGGQKSGND